MVGIADRSERGAPGDGLEGQVQAEPEHQDYLERYPNGYTCHFVRPGWRLPKRAEATAS